ncbi:MULTISPECIES: Stp1/IreP family PP2C-type Ser/Thr phosphatase [unclassified Paenibacillus]|uniref:Stp1/IreP family PP2C-type Ser/Thr phosphatase n=1 Tax=unclassified Paenibacillus TaxID=185978 RepID=UPI001C109468|nr:MULTISPECIES: Stp1/IreP family PP2C-type Ser/Thr phosphatase [unclassified Paenibacillus]MBU5444252.1 Stp1/IreP family PP2C-type Ser/Thr phosphatase [Paenibacillus sp. MSJ-34]CAH0120113.1 Protein phosphatase PrpC [Paenibacillus sp. CECT 9249]
MKVVHRTDIGRRAVNEDRSWAQRLENGYMLAIIADGMGGHQAGEVASRIAVETVAERLMPLAPGLTGPACAEALREAILHANNVIYEMASQDERYHNMGTTIVAVLLNGENGFVGHIGDSRAYNINDTVIRQLTDDHSLVNELLKSGQISLEESRRHPRRNVVIRALGTDAEVEVDINPIQLEQGEILLLCSDGLSDLMTDEEIAAIVSLPSLSLEEKAERLLRDALQAGGEDNITVVLLEQTDDADNGIGKGVE